MFVVLWFGLTATIDLQLHDTYFVFDSIYLAIMASIFLILLGIIYWLFRNYRMNGLLTKIHTAGTLLSIVVFLLCITVESMVGNNGNGSAIRLNLGGMLAMGALVIVQLIFVGNVVVGLVRGRR